MPHSVQQCAIICKKLVEVGKNLTRMRGHGIAPSSNSKHNLSAQNQTNGPSAYNNHLIKLIN